MKYNLSLSEEQVRVLERACKMFSRVQTGQLWAAAEPFVHHQNYHQLREALESLKPLVLTYHQMAI